MSAARLREGVVEKCLLSVDGFSPNPLISLARSLARSRAVRRTGGPAGVARCQRPCGLPPCEAPSRQHLLSPLSHLQ